MVHQTPLRATIQHECLPPWPADEISGCEGTLSVAALGLCQFEPAEDGQRDLASADICFYPLPVKMLFIAKARKI